MGRVFDGMLPGGTETGADVLEIHGVQSTFTSTDRRMSWVGKVL